MGSSIERTPISPLSQDYGEIAPRVDPKTAEFLSVLVRLNLLDNLKPQIKKLITHYFFRDISTRDLAEENGTGKSAISSRVLNGLETAWEAFPNEIKNRYPRKDVVKMKNPLIASPSTTDKKRKAAITLWENEEYRTKTKKSLKKRRWDPQFIEKMREIGRGKFVPGQHNGTSENKRTKISKGVKKSWILRKHDISKDDVDAWNYAYCNDLLPKMQQMELLTQEDIEILEALFNNQIIRKGYRLALNRFSLALIKVGKAPKQFTI